MKIIELLFWTSVFLVAYSYLIYPALLVLFSSLFGRRIRQDDTYLPTVGVLIPVHNEEAVIARKIENILNLDYPADKISIYVGSDCSTDNSDNIVKGFNLPNVHLWRAPSRMGKTGILNNLAPQIVSEMILFTDANTMHRPDCVRMMVRNLADESVGGVAGHIDHSIASNDEYAEVAYRVFEVRQKQMESKLHSTISAFGGFYLIRKKLFKPIPHNAYSNDDVLIPMGIIRDGSRIIYEADAQSFEDMSSDTGVEFKRRVRIGAGNFQAFFWLGDFIFPWRGWPSFCYLSHKVSRWFSPILIVIAIIACALLSLFHSSPLYKMLFVPGVVFIVAGLLHRLFPLRITRHIFYFLAMNVALLLGLLRYMRGIKSASWSRTERMKSAQKN